MKKTTARIKIRKLAENIEEEIHQKETAKSQSYKETHEKKEYH
jgi:hypothetical protein